MLSTRYHDSLWEVIVNFGKEQALVESVIEADLAGGPPPTKKRRVLEIQGRPQSVVLRYDEHGEEEEPLHKVFFKEIFHLPDLHTVDQYIPTVDQFVVLTKLQSTISIRPICKSTTLQSTKLTCIKLILRQITSDN